MFRTFTAAITSAAADGQTTTRRRTVRAPSSRAAVADAFAAAVNAGQTPRAIKLRLTAERIAHYDCSSGRPVWTRTTDLDNRTMVAPA